MPWRPLPRRDAAHDGPASDPVRGWRRPLAAACAVVAAAGLGLAACSSSSASTASAATGAGGKTPLPAGLVPSDISKMVCSHKTQGDITETLGITAQVSTPTWVDHVYGCRYVYPAGTFTLSVKELSSWPQTFSYFNGLASTLGRTKTIVGLGQGAFQTQNGSVVVRKDWKVLLVDASQLPAQFGQPPTASRYAAVTVADVILGCWAGD